MSTSTVYESSKASFSTRSASLCRFLPILLALLVSLVMFGCEGEEESGGGSNNTTSDAVSDTGGGGACDTPDPSLSCLDSGCGEGESCVPSDENGCRPSVCSCDEEYGWGCTADCGQPMVCVEDSACGTPDPSVDCMDTGCAEGEICLPSDAEGCMPSSCFCDEVSGGWGCTEDCGPMMACMPVENDCRSLDPSMDCMDTGCPEGEACRPSGDDGCTPSNCSCDGESGFWNCTADCGQMMACMPTGNVCESPDPSVNCEDTGCPENQRCVPSDIEVCVPSGCSCDEASGGWICTSDCGQPMACEDDPCAFEPPTLECISEECPNGQMCAPIHNECGFFVEACVPIGLGCDTPNPAIDCMDTGCPEGTQCLPTDDMSCTPSMCICDEVSGGWTCTEDCGQPMACLGVPTGCSTPDPSVDCQTTGCASDEICVPDPEGSCLSSACGCDLESGNWTCTADCGERHVCLPSSDTLCDTPDPSLSCIAMGCPDGEACMETSLMVCRSSACFCDASSGGWVCTEDCLPDVACAPITP